MTEHIDFFIFKKLFEMHVDGLDYKSIDGGHGQDDGEYIYGQYLKFLNDLSSQIKKKYPSNPFLDFLHQEINLIEALIKPENWCDSSNILEAHREKKND